MFCFVSHKLSTEWEAVKELILSDEARDQTFIVATKTRENGPFFEETFGPRTEIVMWFQG